MSAVCTTPCRSLPLISPAGSPAAACCIRPGPSASEPAGSWREKPPKESSQGDECARVRVSVCEKERERARGSPKLKTKEHTQTRSGFILTFNHSGRVARHHRSPEIGHTDAESCAAFFFGGSCCVARRAAPWRIVWLEQD